ncbi:exo-alpha-sialidase [Herpetosiphon llansteffanensis]|uniref:exo-alpha-sialidase n=1 Tax=Herpetosiphon llansteffanensis TaxID=2094568 RepID=UPI000D7BEFE4|nr:exo-alpha-sialidase [Herpetosiphon llansteffanensis]
MMWRSLFLLILLVCLLTPAATTAQTPTVTPSAAGWAFDTPRSLGRDIGVIRGLATALDEQGYAHTSYLRASEFMANASHSALIVQGVTRAGDRYERRLWQGEPSAGPTAITARQGRIIVAATLAGTVRLWESRDSGATWRAPDWPVRASVAQLAILPDGRAVLALLTRRGSQFTLTIASERTAGSGSWLLANPLPSSSSAVVAVWQRDAVRTDQGGLPQLVIAQGMAGGVQLANSMDGRTWQPQTIASATPHALALSAVGEQLVVMHEEYGARVLWLASSTLNDGWQVTRLSTPSSMIVEANPLLHNPQTNMIMLLTTCRFPDRPFGSHRAQLCLSRVARDKLHVASAWESQWAEPWTPITMAQPHTAQAGAVVVTHGMQAHMAWVGQFIPSDFLHINATQAGFVTTSEAMATTVRIPTLARMDAP